MLKGSRDIKCSHWIEVFIPADVNLAEVSAGFRHTGVFGRWARNKSVWKFVTGIWTSDEINSISSPRDTFQSAQGPPEGGGWGMGAPYSPCLCQSPHSGEISPLTPPAGFGSTGTQRQPRWRGFQQRSGDHVTRPFTVATSTQDMPAALGMRTVHFWVFPGLTTSTLL